MCFPTEERPLNNRKPPVKGQQRNSLGSSFAVSDLVLACLTPLLPIGFGSFGKTRDFSTDTLSSYRAWLWPGSNGRHLCGLDPALSSRAYAPVISAWPEICESLALAATRLQPWTCVPLWGSGTGWISHLRRGQNHRLITIRHERSGLILSTELRLTFMGPFTYTELCITSDPTLSPLISWLMVPLAQSLLQNLTCCACLDISGFWLLVCKLGPHAVCDVTPHLLYTPHLVWGLIL